MELSKATTWFESYGVQYRRHQLPIINAYALTVHKVQSLSMPSITVCLNDDVFAVGQAYVALSRARKLEDVWLTCLDLKAFKTDPSAIAEYARLREVSASFRGEQ
jgi:ATP-dependent exoDNAse (exonuclease V) alpha subunit